MCFLFVCSFVIVEAHGFTQSSCFIAINKEAAWKSNLQPAPVTSCVFGRLPRRQSWSCKPNVNFLFCAGDGATLHQLGMIWIVLDITSWLMTLLPWTLHSRLVSFHSRNRFEGFRELKKCQDLSDVLQALACQTAAWAHEGSTLIVLIVNTGWYAVYKSWWPLWKRDAPRSWLSCQDPSIHGIGFGDS